jgi:hypothetical protein
MLARILHENAVCGLAQSAGCCENPVMPASRSIHGDSSIQAWVKMVAFGVKVFPVAAVIPWFEYDR